MKEIYEFPKNWFIECNKSNRSILNKWRKEQADGLWHDDIKHFKEGSFLVSKHLNDTSYFHTNIRKNSNYSNYEEITLSQFKKYVLKEKEFKLPKKWFVLYDREEEFNIINKYFNKRWDYKNTIGVNGYFYNSKERTYNNNWVGYDESSKTSLLENSYIQLSFEEFEKYVVNKTTEIKQDKMRTINCKQAQDIINIACGDWKPKLAKIWGVHIVLNETIEITETFYQEMRKACTPIQNNLFDKIFGKDVTFKKGDWVITTTKVENHHHSEKGELIKIDFVLNSEQVTTKEGKTVNIDRIKLVTQSERINIVKRKMIDLASSFDLVPTSITL